MTASDSLLQRAADIVREGGVVIVPTETFYALAADPFQDHAVRRIFRIKGRDEAKPLALIASDRAVVEKLVSEVPPLARRLMDSFWPGSLTILLEPARPMSVLIAGSLGRIGVRVPPPCPAGTLAALAGGVITATSANLSGHPNPEGIRTISSRVLQAVDLIVDMGLAEGGQPSTVVFPQATGLTILRVGAVPAEALAPFVDLGGKDKSP